MTTVASDSVVTPAAEPDAIAAFAPQWCLFWSESVKASQFQIWLPYLRRSRYRYVIAASDDGFQESVRTHASSLPNVRLVASFEATKVALRETKGFRGFLYISTKPENFTVINGFRSSLHVWLGHGESGKAANAFRTASIYDSVFTAHYDGISRFPRAIRQWVGQGACAIGTPIVEGVAPDPWPRPRPVTTLLYAPTWEGYRERADYSSIPEFAPRLIHAMTDLMEAGVKVILRPHPGTGHRSPAHRQLIEDLYAAGAAKGRSKAQDFAEADVMVGDVSGVVDEFLFTQKPTLMPVSPRLFDVIPEAKLIAEYPWVDRWTDGVDIRDGLRALSADDPLRQARARAAQRKFRGHRSLEEATATFDLALAAVRYRKTRLPPRLVFEAATRMPFLRRRLTRR